MEPFYAKALYKHCFPEGKRQTNLQNRQSLSKHILKGAFSQASVEARLTGYTDDGSNKPCKFNYSLRQEP